MPYDAVDGRMMTAIYGVDPYRIPYRPAYVSSPNGTGTVAVIRMPSSRRYGDGVQPYDLLITNLHHIDYKIILMAYTVKKMWFMASRKSNYLNER